MALDLQRRKRGLYTGRSLFLEVGKAQNYLRLFNFLFHFELREKRWKCYWKLLLFDSISFHLDNFSCRIRRPEEEPLNDFSSCDPTLKNISLINSRMGGKRIKNRASEGGSKGWDWWVGSIEDPWYAWLPPRAARTRAERTFVASWINLRVNMTIQEIFNFFEMLWFFFNFFFFK